MPPPGPPGTGMPPLPPVIASATVKPSDLRTSSVITPDPKDQISGGKAPLAFERDVIFSRPVMPNGATKRRWAMDIQMPFLLFHGDQDTLVSPSQTLILHERLQAAGVQSTRYVLKGAGHGDMAFMGDLKSGPPWSTNQVMGLIVDFLRRTLA